MDDGNSVKVMYQARRQARGAEPPARRRPWRRRLIVGGALLALAIAGGVAGYLWWASTRVNTVRAVVCARIVRPAPAADVRVAEVYVRPGERVRRGQPLVRFEAAEFEAALAAALAQQAIATSRHRQAKDTARQIEARVNAEIDLAQAGVEIAAARVASVAAALEYQRTRVPAAIRQAAAERDEARARLERLKHGPRPEEIEAARVRLATAKALTELYDLELKQLEDVVAKGLQARDVLQAKRAQLTAQEGLAREAELTLARLEGGATADELEAAHQALAAREAALALAHAATKELDTFAADLVIRRAELKRAEADLKRAEAGRTEIDLANEQVNATDAEVKRTSAEVRRARQALEAMTLLSPVDGTVFGTFRRPSEFSGKGQPIVTVAEDEAGLWIEGFIREEDAARVKVGQTADVLLNDGSTVRTQVEAVGLSTAAPGDTETAQSPVGLRNPAALVWIRLNPLDPMPTQRHGMTARATIYLR